MSGNIVAIGLLTSDELKRLGDSFNRYYAVPDDNVFSDLMAELDKVAPVGGHRPEGDANPKKP